MYEHFKELQLKKVIVPSRDADSLGAKLNLHNLSYFIVPDVHKNRDIN